MNPGLDQTGNVARRRWLYAAVGLVAASAGFAASWWMRRDDSPATNSSGAIWDMQFVAPGGAALSMRQFSGKPLLLKGSRLLLNCGKLLLHFASGNNSSFVVVLQELHLLFALLQFSLDPS